MRDDVDYTPAPTTKEEFFLLSLLLLLSRPSNWGYPRLPLPPLTLLAPLSLEDREIDSVVFDGFAGGGCGGGYVDENVDSVGETRVF